MQTGLLKTLRTRYATFYFTHRVIVLDVLSYGAGDVHSFLYPRTPQKNPADDFRCMAIILGNAWWEEKKRTNKNYLADRRLLESATKEQGHSKTVNPTVVKSPSVNGTSLIHLKLTRGDLDSPEFMKSIKNAYRLQAKRHHPDLGGDTRTFRKIHQAYEELLNWSANPVFSTRSGFIDKWFYRGDQNRWVQPIPDTAPR
jgi:hypothetical protein